MTWWHWIPSHLEQYSRWGNLRALGNSNLVRSSVLMPIFGYILIWNDKIHEYLVVKYDADSWWHANPTWRIWFIFYGSLFVAIASVIYSWRCPVQVKRYASAFEMADAEKAHHWYLGQYKQVHKTVTALFENRPGWVRKIYPLRDLKISIEPHGQEEAFPWLSILLTHWWNLENIGQRGIRVTTFLMFYLGFGLLLIPSLLTILQVTFMGLRILLS